MLIGAASVAYHAVRMKEVVPRIAFAVIAVVLAIACWQSYGQYRKLKRAK
jgi:hypothetical protein